MTRTEKGKIKQYILDNIGDYSTIRIGSDGRVTGRKNDIRVFIGWDNEFVAYIKEEKMSVKKTLKKIDATIELILESAPTGDKFAKLHELFTKKWELEKKDKKNKKNSLQK
jgi:hypothetical protein